MRFYLGSPNNQMQAHAARGCPVLLSFALYKPWVDSYTHSFDRLLIDSGAYSQLTNPDLEIDLGAYAAWAERYPWADAVAGLDHIRGDWRRSMKNYREFPRGFPTFHEEDPPELLDELIPMAQERGGWIGLGLTPPRQRKEHFLRSSLERIRAVDPTMHVHGFACGLYGYLALDSADSTNWHSDSLRMARDFPWLTPAECLDLVVKREKRRVRLAEKPSDQRALFEEET